VCAFEIKRFKKINYIQIYKLKLQVIGTRKKKGKQINIFIDKETKKKSF